MDLPIEHLATFAAIAREGSFEAAAARLHITPSAVSQRVRAMEQRVGSVLLQRTRPVQVTTAGATILRLARQFELLASDAARELGGDPGSGSPIAVVVNADSLATWFVPALARASHLTGARFDVLRADESISTDRLRSGEAMAALTATAEAVPGCTSTMLGVVRYRAVASPEFAAAHFTQGTVNRETLASAPIVEFDRYDTYQRRFIALVTRAQIDPPRHFIPSSAEFALAVEHGLGWGMLPDLQCAQALAAGRLVELVPGRTLDVPLYWQRWNLSSPMLDTLTRVVEEEAGAALAP
ncbi:LysR family transcriptional regulator ArgP [Leucobacter sp. HY1910]